MKVEKALTLKAGQKVQCPPDRGGAAYKGKIVSFDTEIQTNFKGDPFIWVSVRNIETKPPYISVWPSNRLELLT